MLDNSCLIVFPVLISLVIFFSEYKKIGDNKSFFIFILVIITNSHLDSFVVIYTWKIILKRKVQISWKSSQIVNFIFLITNKIKIIIIFYSWCFWWFWKAHTWRMRLKLLLLNIFVECFEKMIRWWFEARGEWRSKAT